MNDNARSTTPQHGTRSRTVKSRQVWGTDPWFRPGSWKDTRRACASADSGHEDQWMKWQSESGKPRPRFEEGARG
jgi:hypothetical protein